MAAELRSEHHRELERLDISLGGLLAVIPDAVDHATASLLSGDVALRADVDRWQEMVVAISDDVDHTAEVIIARQAPLARELRFLMACVRVVLTVSCTIDLVAEIGGSAALSRDDPIPPRARPMLEAIGHEASSAWKSVSDLWHAERPAGRGALRLNTDRMVETRTSLVAEMAAAGTDSIAAGELAMALHSYELIVAHARSAGHLLEGVTHPDYRSKTSGADGPQPGSGEAGSGDTSAGGTETRDPGAADPGSGTDGPEP